MRTILLAMILLLVGCQSTPKATNGIYDQVELPGGSFEIITAKSFNGYFLDLQAREIIVGWSGSYDINGEPLPDFYDLGQAVWDIVQDDRGVDIKPGYRPEFVMIDKCSLHISNSFGGWPYRVMIADASEIQARWSDRFQMDGMVGGFIDYDARDIWVPWSGQRDKNKRLIPGLYVFGHEIWHIPKGAFHESNTSRWE